VLRDFGEPIYKSSSQVALLRGLDSCIDGHESLHKAGFLHRDTSVNNLFINEDDDNAYWTSPPRRDDDHTVRNGGRRR